MSANKNVVGNAYESVRQFNDIAGNLTYVTAEGIDNQISLIWEEFEETLTAAEEGDSVGVLDGTLDLFVVVSGLMQKLEAAGYNVAEGLKRVTENNMTKFPPLGSVFDYDKSFKLSYNGNYKRSVILDGNGKIRKPVGYTPVYLGDLIPGGKNA